MDDTPTPFHEENLSAEDLAVLREFDAMEFIVDELGESGSPDEAIGETPQNVAERLPASALLHADTIEEFSQEDMLLLFIGEIEEDVNVLRTGVQHLESGEMLDVARLHMLERKAHKIKGTAGTFNCHVLSAIARYVETLIRLMKQGSLEKVIALPLLIQALSALEGTLTALVTTGEESRELLEELEATVKDHALDIADQVSASSTSLPESIAHEQHAFPDRKQETSHITPKPPQ
ncbi:MAG TPA: Hpt domain-containing protein, partial [Ktedonobacteraceae bacterium]|nr:Hpt domain-containing protein [Ktedonobacteraceae bacterium]